MKKLLFVLGLALLPLIEACEGDRRFKIVAARQPSSLLLCLAEHMKLWDSAYPIPEIIWMATQPEAIDYFVSGKADVGLANVSTFVPSLLKDPKIVIFSEIYNSSRGVQVVVRQSSQFTSSRDLSGKTIGYIESTSAEIFLEYFLLTEGVNLESVKKISLGLNEMKRAFAQGKIDAMVLWEPELSRFKREYPGIVLTEFRSFVHESTGILAGRSDLDANGVQFIEGLLKSLIRAEKAYWEEPEQAFEAYARCLNEESDKKALKESLVDARGEVKITNSLRLNYDRNREWLILRKAVPPSALPTFQSIIRPEILRRVRSRSVTLGGAS
jgi:sulfonate transport system substrate-binding protein